MSRSGYVDDWDDDNSSWLYRGAVASAFRGKRGQDFLKELLAALDAMPEKKLTYEKLECEGDVCALGAVGKARSLDMSMIDPEDYKAIAAAFGIAQAMAREIMYENDDERIAETPEQRWSRMRNWISGEIIG